jgi:hypothetical protein
MEDQRTDVDREVQEQSAEEHAQTVEDQNLDVDREDAAETPRAPERGL